MKILRRAVKVSEGDLGKVCRGGDVRIIFRDMLVLNRKSRAFKVEVIIYAMVRG